MATQAQARAHPQQEEEGKHKEELLAGLVAKAVALLTGKCGHLTRLQKDYTAKQRRQGGGGSHGATLRTSRHLLHHRRAGGGAGVQDHWRDVRGVRIRRGG